MDKMKLMLYSPHQTNAIMLLDRTCHTVYCNGQCIVISATEFSLLWALAEKSRKIVSREDLLQCAWGYNAIGKARTVDVHIQRLRKKIGALYIETVYKKGYRIYADIMYYS